MKSRASLSWVLALFFVLLASGCAISDPKPQAVPMITDTQEFFEDTVKFERRGGKVVEIMDRAGMLQKMISSKDKNDPNPEMSLYRLYVKADTDHDHVITEQEAEIFWTWYQRQFDANIGPIKFK